MPYRDYTPNYALIHAVRHGNVSRIREAVSQGADIHARSVQGQSVLEVAQANSRADLVDLLVELGADPNRRLGKQQQTLLHRCAKTGDIGFANALLRAKANPNIQNQFGQTPLHLAAAGGWEYLARALLEAGADPSITADNGKLPESVAFENAHVNLTQLLFESRRKQSSVGSSWTQQVASDDIGYQSVKTTTPNPCKSSGPSR